MSASTEGTGEVSGVPSGTEGSGKTKSRLRRVLAVFLLLALAGLAVSAVLFAQWTEVDQADQEQAASAFEAALASCPDTRPYLVANTVGGFSVNRTLEAKDRPRLSALNVLTWHPDHLNLVRISLPMWFVRVKTNRKINLGTFTSIVARDWDHLDLSVTTADLRRRGAGLVLDHEAEGGRRIMLWTE